MNESEKNPAAVVTARRKPHPHLRRKLNPQKTHSPLWPKLPRRGQCPACTGRKARRQQY